MSLMWMPPQTTVPPLSTARSAAGTSAPTGREQDRRVERLGRRVVGGARPLRAELAREALRVGVARPREGEHAPALVARDLDRDVRRRAEAVEAERRGVARHAQAAVADQPRAQERRRGDVVERVREREAEARVGHRVARRSRRRAW